MLPPAPKDIPALYARAVALQQAGQAAEALPLYRSILLTLPDTPEVLFQIGRIEAAAGRAAEAETQFRKALALKPKEPAIWQALHAVLRGADARKLAKEAARVRIVLGIETDAAPILKRIAKDAADAETRALALVKAAPEAFWPAYALGRARLAQGNWAGALGPLEMAHRRDPDHPEAQVALGQCLARLDQPLRAEELLLPLAERVDAARLSLARLYRDLMRLEDAAELLRAATAGARKGRTLATELALTEAALGETDRALRAAEIAVKAGANAEPLYRNLASALEQSGKATGARVALDAGRKHAGGTPGLAVHRATLLQSDGAFSEADEVLTRVLDAHPSHAPAYRAYFGGRKVRADDTVWAQLQQQLGRPDQAAETRRIMGFAAAKALHDLGQHKESFAHLERANRLSAQAFPYGFEADLAEARALVADWTALRDLSVEDACDDPVLFVTGLPRSGTTLVETILAAHSAVGAGGEMPFLGRALAPAMETLRNGAPDAARFAEAGHRYLRAGRRRAGADLFTDKAISTFSRIGHLVRALPGAKVVILRRDPRDVGLSMYRNMFADGMHRYTNDLTTMGRYIRLHDALVSFWAEVLPDHVHFVDYEALTADPEPHIRALIEFTGLPWEDACLTPEQADRRVTTLSFAQVRAPIGQQAVAGWRSYEAALAPLIEALEAGEPSLT